MVVERGRHRADVEAAAGRQVARRPALHRGRRQMHLGSGDRLRQGKAARQSAQALVPQPRGGHERGRPRGALPPETAAARLRHDAGIGLLPGLPVPCPCGADAPASDRHRTLQVRRVQAEPGHQDHPLVNRNAPPFDNADLRRAMALSIDQQASIDVLTEGLGKIGGVMLPPPEGIWGMPPDVLHKLSGYDPDTGKRREEARQIMKKLGYGPDKHLPVKVSTRDLPFFREPAVILNDQLKQIYIDGEIEPIDTTSWFPKIMRKDYAVGMNLTGNSLDDPDQNFFENFLCGALANIDGYCNPGVEKLMIAQSMEANQDRRKTLVWEIERLLAEDVARPMIFYAPAANCWNPKLKGLTIPINGIYNGWRMEDAWLEN